MDGSQRRRGTVERPLVLCYALVEGWEVHIVSTNYRRSGAGTVPCASDRVQSDFVDIDSASVVLDVRIGIPFGSAFGNGSSVAEAKEDKHPRRPLRCDPSSGQTPVAGTSSNSWRATGGGFRQILPGFLIVLVSTVCGSGCSGPRLGSRMTAESERPGAGASSIRSLQPIPAEVWKRFGTQEEGEGVDPGEASSLQVLVDQAPDGSVIAIPAGEYYGSLAIRGRRQLTLLAEPGTAWLIQKDEFADVIVVSDSEDILMQGLGMMHSTPAVCTGDALVIHNTRHVTVRECDISGSGTVGILVAHSADITVEHNHIHHCTQQTVSLVEVYEARIVDNLFRENREEDTTEEGVALIWAEGTVEISGNTFADNTSTPVTILRSPIDLCEENSGPFASVVIRDNVFFQSQSPEKPESIFHAWEEGLYPESEADKVTVTGNCFEKTDGRSHLEAHVTSGGTVVSGNSVVPIVLDQSFQPASPAECVGKGAPVIQWLPQARNPIARNQQTL